MPAACRRPAGPAQAGRFTEDEIEALAAYVASLGPGPAIPARSRTTSARRPTADRPRWRAVPHQLRGVPQLRRRRRCAAERQVRAVADGRQRRKHIYEAMITGPQNMPVFGDERAARRRTSATSSRYLKSLQEQTRPRVASPSAGSARCPRVCGAGSSVIGAAGRRHGLDRRQGRHRPKGAKARMSHDENRPAGRQRGRGAQPGRTVAGTADPGPGHRAAPAPAHRHRPEGGRPGRATGVRRMFGLVRRCSRSARRRVLRSSRATRRIDFGPLSGNANNLILGLGLGLALFLIGVGAIQWAKKLMADEEIVRGAARHCSPRGDRPRSPTALQAGRRRSPASAGAR